MKSSFLQVALAAVSVVSALNAYSAGTQPVVAADATAPAVLSGNGPAQHPFLYAGEWDTRKPQQQSMFIVRGGKVVWQYTMPLRSATGATQRLSGN
jgi:hypothetical protein